MKSAALLWPVAGLLGWAAAFVLVYGLHGIGCASGWHEVPAGATDLQRLVQVGSAGACVCLLAALAAWLHWRRAAAFSRAGEHLLAGLTRVCAWSGLAATAFTLLPVLVASVCR